MSSAAGKPNNHNKRKYHKWNHRNPKRGGPGVLMTCETGREVKCQREGLDILNYYYSPKDKVESKKDSSSLSLEDELKMLRSKRKANAASSMFGVYDTCCRGSVFVMCTQPGCNIIPAVKVEEDKEDDKDENSNKKRKQNEESKKGDVSNADTVAKSNSNEKQPVDEKTTPVLEETENSQAIPEDESPWDPVETVRSIISDIQQNSTEAPGSRFVTRMIPMQATCFASAEEIRLTSRALLTKLFAAQSYKTFAISAKKRICSNITRDEIIDTIATIVVELNPDCKVDLNNPEATIIVEICRTLCGISVVPRSSDDFHNFNLVAAREDNTTTEADEEAKEADTK